MRFVKCFQYSYLALLIFSVSTCAHADGQERHLLASAGLTTALYYTVSSLTGREKSTKPASLVGAVAMTLAAGLAVEAMQSMQRGDRNLDSSDLKSNLIGVGCATGLILAIDF